jgi:hypothetical protein
MRRWITRILLILFGLLFVTIVTIQVILFTDIPQRLIIETLNKELDMKVTAGSIRTNLQGKTTIKDFALSLPMEDNSLLLIPEMNLSHTAIPLILFSRSFTLHSARIVNPIVNIRENETGLWNIQEFVYHLQQVSTVWKKQKELRLLQLDIVNGASVITYQSGRIENVGPIFFQGKPQIQPVWNFEMNIASNIMASGRLTEGGIWSHEVHLNVADIPDFVKILIPGSPDTLKANIDWKGYVRGNGLAGKLQLEQVQCGGLQSSGILAIEMSLSGILIDFDSLQLRGLKVHPEEIRIFGGSVQFDGKQLQADRVLLDTGQSNASFTGRWNLGEEEGSFNGFWGRVITKQNIDYESSWSGTISRPRIGKKQINLSIATQGKSSSGSWQSEARILGTGNTLSNSQWQITIPSLELQLEDANIKSRNIAADIAVEWPDIRLVSLDSSNAEQLNAEGEFSADTLDWTVSVNAAGLKANERQSSPFDLRLSASGSRKDIAVKELRMVYKDLQLEAAGNMALPSNDLSNAHANTSRIVRSQQNANESLVNVSGNMKCETVITGTIWPTNLRFQSVLSGKDITLNKKVIGDITIPWNAEVDANRVKYVTEQFPLFGGTLNFNGEYEFSQHSTKLDFYVNHVLLKPVTELFDLPPDCRGLMTANLNAQLSLDDLNQSVISGNWNVKDMVMPPIEADNAEGQFRIENGTARFDQIRLNRSQGQALAAAWFKFDQPQDVSFEVEAQQWPVYMPDYGMAFVTDVNCSANLNLLSRSIKGRGHLFSSATIDDKKFANVSANIVVDGHTLDFSDIRMEALGGIAGGKALIPLDNWIDSNAAIQWSEMDLGSLALCLPELEGLAGKTSGTLNIAKAEDRRPLEPLQIEMNGKVSEGDYRSAKIGGYKISAFLGKKRLLIDKMELEAMDGTIQAAGSLSQHAGGLSMYGNTNFSQLELNQIVHSILPNAKPVLGRLTGKGMLVIFSDLHGMTGQVNINLSESDLARTLIVSTLYDTMNLKIANNEPVGQGQVRLRFEGSSLEIPSFVYFNRGVEIRGGVTIDDITQVKTSPIRGYAVGSARPLKSNSLLGIDELDRLMTSLQSSVSSVKIYGTIAEPKVSVVPFQEISRALRVLLLQQLLNFGKNDTD